jgi:putative ABC transport system substrate-binding protein
VRRREFITLLSGAAAWPLAARAQQPGKLPRIGVLWHAATAEDEKIPLSWIQQGLKDFGYVDGQNILLEHRYPAERADLFQKFAVELA